MRRWRQYLSSAGATIAVFLMTSLAFAGPGELPEQANEKAEEAVSQEKTETEEPKLEEAEVEEEDGAESLQEGDDVVNHGHCVSYWARQSKGLTGRAKGEFISSIAKNPEAISKKVAEGGEPDGTCDFGDDLAAAQDSVSASSNGKGNGKGKGRPGR
ncbi:MAG: hypothetical protein KY429_09795 [Actinobacteria bacterium]|nr:hypothetical protein [Actinomycetota bacterium]